MGSTVKGAILTLKLSGNIMKLYIQRPPVYRCVLCASQYKQLLIFLNSLHCVDFATETVCVYSAVRIESLDKLTFRFKSDSRLQ